MEDQIFNQTANGLVFKCSTCNKIHIEFKNLNFNFDEDQHQYFIQYITNLNGLEWENKNADSSYRRKIVIPIGHSYFKILLNNDELVELQQLLNPTLADDKLYRVIGLDAFSISCYN